MWNTFNKLKMFSCDFCKNTIKNKTSIIKNFGFKNLAFLLLFSPIFGYRRSMRTASITFFSETTSIRSSSWFRNKLSCLFSGYQRPVSWFKTYNICSWNYQVVNSNIGKFYDCVSWRNMHVYIEILKRVKKYLNC